MRLLADIVKDLIRRAVFVVPLLLCAPPAVPAAVMDFPDTSVPGASLGLAPETLDAINNVGEDNGDAASTGDGEMNLLPKENFGTTTDDILNSVLGVSRSDNWLEEARKAETGESVTAFDLMRAYVNVVNSAAGPASRPTEGEAVDGDGNSGNGFLMTIAEGVDDPETLNLMTKVMQPHVEDDLVTFSLLGLGQFLILGEAETGDLIIMNVEGGQRLDLRKSSPAADDTGKNGRASAPSSSANFVPHEEEALAHIMLLFFSVATNPLFLLTAVCVFGIWAIYRLARRLS